MTKSKVKIILEPVNNYLEVKNIKLPIKSNKSCDELKKEWIELSKGGKL